MAYKAMYVHDIELSFNYNRKSTTILKESVKYIIIDTDYRKRIMPIIYMNLSIQPSVYNSMVSSQGIGKLFLRIWSKDTTSNSSVEKTYIYDEFDYYMTDDPNAFKKLDETGESSGQAYKNTTIGLIKTDLVRMNAISTSDTIYKNCNTASIVQNVMSKMSNKIIIQPFSNNIQLDNFPCPAFSTIGQFISYINSRYSFYNGSYVYFLDFDKTYLRSNDGSYIDIKDGDFQYIAIDIRDLTSYQAFTTGLVIDKKQKAYIIYVDGNNANITTNRETQQQTSSITVIDSHGNMTQSQTIDTEYITNVTSSSNSTTVIKSDDPNAAQSSAATIYENTGQLIINKTSVDSRIFTLNKSYILANYQDNTKYNGTYYPIFKKELFVRTGDHMDNKITLGLQRVNKNGKFI